MFTNNNGGEVAIPKTITSGWVLVTNLTSTVLMWGILFFFFNLFWGSVLTGLGLAAVVAFGLITVEVVDFHGLLLFNPLTKSRRVIFPGLHLKLFWESIEEGSLESLRRIISSKGEENLPTNDPAENMKVHLTVHKRVNVSGTPEEAAQNFISFHSIDDASLTTVVRKEIVKKFGAYYGVHELEDLTNANAVQQAVFADTDIAAKIKEMEDRWGVSIGVILDTSNPDEATKDMKRTPARAESLRKAIKKLTETGPNGEKGLGDDEARRAALLLDPNADFTESRDDFNVNIAAPDLKNLRDVSLIPPGMLGGKKGNKK